MAPRNPRLVFLEQALRSLKKQLPDASQDDLLKSAEKMADAEFPSAATRAAQTTEARKVDLQERAAAEAKERAERAANPQGLVEKIIGAPGSDRRNRIRDVGITGGLGTALGAGVTGLMKAAEKVAEKSVDDSLPPATAPSGKAPLTPSAGQVTDFINSIQKFNENLRGQAMRLRLRFDFEGADRLEAQQIDPAKALQDYREGSRTDFGFGTQRQIEQDTAGYEAEQELERIRQEAENRRKVLDLAGQVIQSTEGSMNIDLLPTRQY